MPLKKQTPHMILHTEIEDIRISSVLDKGFFASFGVTPQMHSHTFFELLFALEGDLQLQLLNGERLLIPERHFCLIQPMVYHSTHRTGQLEKKLALCFQIEKNEKNTGFSFYDLCMNGLQAAADKPLIFACEELCGTLTSFKREVNLSMPASEAYASALLLQCYVLLFRTLCQRFEVSNTYKNQESTDLSVSRKVQIEDYLYHHSCEAINQDDMAGFLNISTRQLNRILQQLYGTSFRRLLIDVRLHKAAQLLANTQCPIEEIAATVGYTSLSGFYAAFDATFGVSAGKYRKQSLQTDFKTEF